MVARVLLPASALLSLAIFSSMTAATTCDAHGIAGLNVPGPGPVFVPFPTPVPTPGGRIAAGAYYDDRPEGTILGVQSPLGFLQGHGTWVYFETNGMQGLQRGGQSDLGLPGTPLGNPDTHEFAECSVADPDEMVI